MGVTDPVRDYWDAQAPSFDEEPDHGLRDPEVRRAWLALLREHLPAAPATVADLGCGTGSLTVLLAEDGYAVHGIDLSDEMVAAARSKAARSEAGRSGAGRSQAGRSGAGRSGVPASFAQGDASAPDLEPGTFDVVLSRHVLWALPDPSAALERWVALLRPGGRLVLVEGRWSTGAGLAARRCEALVREHRQSAVVLPLPDPVFWGREIDDERYLLVSLD